MNQRVLEWEKKTEKFFVGLSLIFIAILIIPLAHPLSGKTKDSLQVVDYVIWGLFAFDYIFKFSIATNKKHFAKSHLLELFIVIIPALRPLRLVRLIPIVGFFLNYSQKNLAGKLVHYVSLITVVVTVPAAIITYQIERNANGANIKTFGDAIWWSITTIFTVGYGDRFPVTGLGKVMATLVMLSGISLVGVITASIASWFVRSDEEKSDAVQLHDLMRELQEIKARIEKLEK